jgi:hypothetical protein
MPEFWGRAARNAAGRREGAVNRVPEEDGSGAWTWFSPEITQNEIYGSRGRLRRGIWEL